MSGPVRSSGSAGGFVIAVILVITVLTATGVIDAGRWLDALPSVRIPKASATSGGPDGQQRCSRQRLQECKTLAKAYAKKQLRARGMSGQWGCLRDLWTGESGWNPWAENDSSGAYGIPQTLPSAHGRPFAFGDYKAQIIWGLDYIERRYDTPCEALRFWKRHKPHWY